MAVRESRVGGSYASKVGLMYPQSPRGEASLMDLNTEPDLVIADDVLLVGWETDPEVTREYLPEPLESDGSGRMYLMSITRWGYTGRNYTEFISAERLTQSESSLKIPCSYQGQKYLFRSFSWGNRDWLRAAGHQVGLYHKWAEVQMTQFHPFHPTWDRPHQGARVCVTVENIGTVLRAYGELKRVVGEDELLPEGVSVAKPFPNIGHRYFYDSCTGVPARNDLVLHQGTTRETGPIWKGDGWIQFGDAENEEVQQFAPKRMIGAWWWQMRFRKGEGSGGYHIVHEYGEEHPYTTDLSRPRTD